MSIGLYFIILIWLIIYLITDKKAPLNRLAVTVKNDTLKHFRGCNWAGNTAILPVYFCFDILGCISSLHVGTFHLFDTINWLYLMWLLLRADNDAPIYKLQRSVNRLAYQLNFFIQGAV
jgi:hypothetical protein